MKLVYLVINNSHGGMMPYKDRFRLFKDADAAVGYAGSVGYDSPMPVDWKPGMMNMSICGDIDVSMIALAVLRKDKR